MKKSNMLACIAVIVVFLFAQMGIAYADVSKGTLGTGEHAAGILTDNTQKNGGNSSVLETTGGHAFGVYVSGDNSSWTFEDNTLVKTTGYYSYGVAISGDVTNPAKPATISFGNGTVISTEGDHADGVVIRIAGSSVGFGDGTVITTGGESADGAFAIAADSSIRFGDDTSITLYGTNGSAVFANGTDSSISFGNRATITAADTSNSINSTAYGVYVTGNRASSRFGDDAVITTTGNGAHGAYVNGSGNSSIDFGNNAAITTTGNGAHGTYVSADNAHVTFGDKATIATAGDNANGAVVSGNASSVSFGDALVITTNGSQSHGARTNGNAASIKFNGDTEITTSANDAYALYASQGTISSTQASRYTISGDMVAGTGMIDLDMSAGSLFTGKTDAGNGNITLNMAGSRWNVTGDSNLTYLSLDATTVDYSNTALGTTITTGTLDGPGGTFVMKTDIVNMTADMLEITNTMNGSQHYITVHNDGSAATTGNEVVDLVDTADATGSFRLTHAVELGAWEYSLRQMSGGGYGSLWQLYASGYSTTTEVVIGTLYSDYLLNYAETQTLIQRLGDLRTTPQLNGFWFKAHGGNFESRSGWMAQSFDMDYWGVQLGYDRKVEINWDGTVYAGVMFGYGKGDTDYISGSSDVESKTVGVYGAFIHPNGFFADLVLKYRWSDSDFDSIDSAGTLVTGRGASSNGFGASLELGQRVPLKKSGNQKSGWYVEPQVQLSMQRLGGGYFYASNGLHIGAEKYTSVLGRLGMLVGYETEKSNFYAKASKVKEFRGDVTILANSQPIDISFGSSWWVYGLGYTSRLDDRNSIYIDLERASGGLFTQTWAAKAGWRMEF